MDLPIENGRWRVSHLCRQTEHLFVRCEEMCRSEPLCCGTVRRARSKMSVVFCSQRNFTLRRMRLRFEGSSTKNPSLPHLSSLDVEHLSGVLMTTIRRVTDAGQVQKYFKMTNVSTSKTAA